MKKNNKIVVLILVLTFAIVPLLFFSKVHQHGHSHKASATYYCPMHPTYTSDKPGNCPICQMKLVKNESQQTKSLRDVCYLHTCPMVHKGKPCPMLVVAKDGERVTCPICGSHVSETETAPRVKKILYWTDPMIPGYKSDQPGKSPMGMNLIPVYEEATPGSMAGSAATPDGYAPILITPQKQQLIGIKTTPAKKMTITKTVRTSGRIAYDPTLYQAEQEYIQAVQALKKAEAGGVQEAKDQASQLVDSAKIKLKLMGLNDDLMKEIEESGKPDRSLLYSEIGGTVWLYAPIYEYEIPLVKVGSKIEAEASAIPEKKLQGVIRSIDPVLDPATRSVRVRAVLDNSEGILKPEMYVSATLQVDLGEVLAVPEEAVFSTGEKSIVFVQKEGGVFEPREVSVGVKSEGYKEIRSGVSEGENVVVSGNFLIDSESRLKGALEGISGGGHQHGG